ncbi:hypothetical protein C8R44DRAFT_393828 [Mycena epipterygia]|nr:hypothetical protein C8R44DRAFT_393828 [Mycena epipterygia]
MVLSACGLTCDAKDITVLREGSDMGRQAVFDISRIWIVRIFELHDGYRQPAEFISDILTALEMASAPSERVRHHGIVERTPFHYTVTEFCAGVELTRELCADQGVGAQIAALQHALRDLSVPDTVGTVEEYMQPRLARLYSKLDSASLTVAQRKDIGDLSALADFQPFRMVVSHCDISPENIIARSEPQGAISVIDWEFCTYVPEFRIDSTFRYKAGRELWGDGFLDSHGFKPYPKQVVWTERLCMIAEDYDGAEFEAGILGALNFR